MIRESEMLFDADELDPVGSPPDQRHRFRDKEAWVYRRPDGLLELVWVRFPEARTTRQAA